jgi:tryptophan 2,3-dioxygenase
MLTYSTYLRLTDLLAQQRPRSCPAAHDELMLITVHQASELWFKLLLFELGDARDLMLAGHIAEPRDRLRRCRVIVRLLADQFDVLDTMAPADFGRLRHALGAASGVQSAQFAGIECLSGLRDSGPPADPDRFSGAEFARLRRRLAEPTVWDGFINVLAKAGFDVSSAGYRSAAYAEIAENPGQHPVLWDPMEALLDHDQT